MKCYFVTGIDTDCGKTFITGHLARQWQTQGHRVLTHKPIQTGCTQAIADDIIEHRRIMGIPPTLQDQQGLTCPYILPLAASPHLAAKSANIDISITTIIDSIGQIAESNQYDKLLIEGAGGLFVPMTENYTTLNFIKESPVSLIVVLSSKLGSINHSVLTLSACKQHQLIPEYIIYNAFPDTDKRIATDSHDYLKTWCRTHLPTANFMHSDDLTALH